MFSRTTTGFTSGCMAGPPASSAVDARPLQPPCRGFSWAISRPFVLGNGRAAILVNGRRISDSTFDLDTLPISAVRTRRDTERHRRRPARRARNRRRYQHRAQARLRGRRGPDEGGNDRIIKSRRARGLPPAPWTQRVWPNKKGPAEFPLPPGLGLGFGRWTGAGPFHVPISPIPVYFCSI